MYATVELVVELLKEEHGGKGNRCINDVKTLK